MKVLLREDVIGVGKRGDIVDVAGGFARNFLVPTGRAILATDGISQQASAMRRARDLRDVKDLDAARLVATRLEEIVITIPARAGREGRLFGSVTPADVVDALSTQASITVDRHRFVHSEPLRTLGHHEVAVRLHPDVEGKISIEVVAES